MAFFLKLMMCSFCSPQTPALGRKESTFQWILVNLLEKLFLTKIEGNIYTSILAQVHCCQKVIEIYHFKSS